MLCRPFFRIKFRINAASFILPILVTAPIYAVPRFFEVETSDNVTFVCATNNSKYLQLNLTAETFDDLAANLNQSSIE